jgi:hypothetical protein
MRKIIVIDPGYAPPFDLTSKEFFVIREMADERRLTVQELGRELMKELVARRKGIIVDFPS